MTSACPIHLHAARTPDAPALLEGERTWTYAQLDAETASWALRLRARGVGRGDRVAVVSRNRPELIPMFHAAARVGAVWVPLNARLTAPEISDQVARVRPKWMFADPDLVSRVPGAESIEPVSAPDASSRADAPTRIAAGEEDVRAILFTSGTSGVPKGAELTYANFEASARGSAANLGGDSDQRWLACLPLFHIGGLAMVHRCGSYGAMLVLHRRFDAAAVVRDLARLEITHLSVVPTGLSWLLDAFDGPAPDSLRAVLVGGGPLPAALAARGRIRGLRVLQTYGLTEACSQVTTERPGDADGQTAGYPIEGVRIRIATTGKSSEWSGVIGEIEVRGPTVMRGYLEEPEATNAALGDGWLRTGDIGSIDAEGRLTVLARRTDVILSGGENVYPAEVEAALASHPDLAEVAVVGVEEVRWGQVAIALCAPHAGSRVPEADALERWCRERLAGFKVPKRFVAVPALSRTESGKVDRAWARAVASGAAPRSGAARSRERIQQGETT